MSLYYMKFHSFGLKISTQNADLIKVEGFTMANSKGLSVSLYNGSINFNKNAVEMTSNVMLEIQEKGDTTVTNNIIQNNVGRYVNVLAVFNFGEGNITITDNKFLKNSSSLDGGAISAGQFPLCES